MYASQIRRSIELDWFAKLPHSNSTIFNLCSYLNAQGAFFKNIKNKTKYISNKFNPINVFGLIAVILV
jgi:hypothetical protein